MSRRRMTAKIGAKFVVGYRGGGQQAVSGFCENDTELGDLSPRRLLQAVKSQ